MIRPATAADLPRIADIYDAILTQEESGGPPRKYYSLTRLGRETYETDRAQYLLFAASVKKLLEDDADE